MQYAKRIVLVALTFAVACGGTTTTVDEGESGGEGGGGGASASGGKTGAGGASTGGNTGAGGASTGGKVGAGGAVATGGTASAGGASSSGGSAGAAGAGTGGITPGCSPIPTVPQYTCMMRGYQEGDCYEWQPRTALSADRVLPGYPQGCEVILPVQDAFSRCGPQRCTCQSIPDASGVMRSDWLCPL